MNIKIYDIDEITYSREIMDQNPSKFITIFIYIILLLITVTFVWAYMSEMDIYVSAPGTVRPNEDVSIVKSQTGGKLESVFVQDDTYVYENDLLFLIGRADLTNEFESINIEIEELNTKIADLEKYYQSIDSETNLFEPSTEYYTLIEKYLVEKNYSLKQIELADKGVETKRKNSQVELDALNTTIRNKKSELEAASLYKSAIQSDKTFFNSNNAEYNSRFDDYRIKMNAYFSERDNLRDKAEQNETLYKEGVISKNDYESSVRNYENIKTDIDKYKQTELVYIDQVIESLNKEISSSTVSLNTLTKNLNLIEDNDSADQLMLIKKDKLELLASIDSQIKNNKDSLRDLSNKIKEVETQKEESYIVAPREGILILNRELTAGEILQSGEEIGTIIPNTNNTLRVELIVSNKDIANIKIGQKINFRFSAIPYKEFGVVEGEVIKISNDAEDSLSSAEKVFIVEAAIQNVPLQNHKGESRDIKIGMTANAQVVTGNKKILMYLLEKIDFIS